MKINFIVNDYMLIWNLLYGSSISIKTHALKQRLWLTYKKEYKKIENDKDKILCDIKNFIPDDNTLYDKFIGSNMFNTMERETEKHRMNLLKLWDSNKKKICSQLDNLLKIKIDDFSVVVIYPQMNSVLSNDDTVNIAWGNSKDLVDPIITFLSMIELSLQNINSYSLEEDRKIFESVIHMAVVNEAYSNLCESNYRTNNKNKDIEKKIYPYFLMYMGVELDDVTRYMMRDNMPFDINMYKDDNNLDKLNILEFIDYIVKNKEIL